ncbi:hypothetical protein DDE83_001102 [Stemphylium lycopersici]|uniref:Uncharacterized protein n=1 Tax=Stemphylium lycopersici TaxID=183478 RepID=A0A364NED8_STELY|nr:hypothetical protein DDE83_001102 [Stemphylium lycopersici]
MVPKKLQLPKRIENYQYNNNANIQDLADGTFKTTGNVTYALASHTFRDLKVFLVDSDSYKSGVIVPKKIDQKIAEKLDGVKSASTLFTFDIWKNVAFIPCFDRIISLADVLTLRDFKPLEQRHVTILVNDIIEGISSLHENRLQRGSFSEQDILLVCRGDQISFQIERQVLGSAEISRVREKVGAEYEKQKAKYEEKAKHEDNPSWSKDIFRKELAVYFPTAEAVVTAVGGAYSQEKIPRAQHTTATTAKAIARVKQDAWPDIAPSTAACEALVWAGNSP